MIAPEYDVREKSKKVKAACRRVNSRVESNLHQPSLTAAAPPPLHCPAPTPHLIAFPSPSTRVGLLLFVFRWENSCRWWLLWWQLYRKITARRPRAVREYQTRIKIKKGRKTKTTETKNISGVAEIRARRRGSSRRQSVTQQRRPILNDGSCVRWRSNGYRNLARSRGTSRFLPCDDRPRISENRYDPLH